MTHPPILYRFTTFLHIFLPFCPFLYFLRVRRGRVSIFLRNLAADQASHADRTGRNVRKGNTGQGGSKQTSMEHWRLRTPFVRTAKGKGRFLNVTCLCKSNFATLNSYHSGNATKRSRGCIISRLFVAISISW